MAFGVENVRVLCRLASASSLSPSSGGLTSETRSGSANVKKRYLRVSAYTKLSLLSICSVFVLRMSLMEAQAPLPLSQCFRSAWNAVHARFCQRASPVAR